MAPTPDHLSNSLARPIRLFVLVMLLVFVAEAAIMLVLPRLPAWVQKPIVLDILDASLLTLAIAPGLWWLVVLPMRRLLDARGQLVHRLFQVQEQERGRIARDLHDEIGQHLTALLVGLKNVESAPDLGTARQRAAELRELAATAHKEVGRLARGLRPGVLEELRLEAALDRFCEEFQAVHQIPVQLNVSAGACDDLTTAVEIALYRIAQEALTNAARHANARGIEVLLRRQENRLTLRVRDYGQGFRPADDEPAAKAAGKLGLASIRERAAMLGGDCAIHSERGKGSVVQVSIPLAGPLDEKNSRLHRG
jgi:signal transduction histidine kinase